MSKPPETENTRPNKQAGLFSGENVQESSLIWKKIQSQIQEEFLVRIASWVSFSHKE